MKNILTFFLIYFSPFVLNSQVLDLPENPREIVAKIDSIEISAEEFFFGYEYGPAFIKRKPESKERYLNFLINEKLLALEGYARNIDTTEQAEEMLAEFKSDLATEELFKLEVLSKVELSDGEIDTAINKKNIELEIKWLYAESDKKAKEYLDKINDGIPFDSLHKLQLNDSVFYDDRYLKTDRFKLEQTNPVLASIIDSLEPGDVSLPVHVDEGWYLMQLSGLSQSLINSEEEFLRLKEEAVNALTKIKMDKFSDEYINSLMFENKPVIKRNAFNLLRSYLGKFLLPAEQYGNWDLSKKMNDAIQNLNKNNQENFSEEVLVDLKNDKLSLKDFLIWYRNRSLYINLNNKDLASFSSSLEELVWRMVRDKLLAKTAHARGLDELASVKKQTLWWKDKIVSSIVKNEIANAAMLTDEEIKKNGDGYAEKSSEKINEELSAKLFRTINSLKKKYSIKIDQKVLDGINVSVENDPNAIDFYTVKKGGIIPRTPYPTIDIDWMNWE